METKYCRCCENDLTIDEFNKNKTKSDGLQVNCKTCQNKRQSNWYQNNKEKHRLTVKEYKATTKIEIYEKIRDYLLEHPCVKCGEDDLIVLEFDHLGDKIENISDMVSQGTNWNKIYAEIQKCQVLCANCHKRKTAEQFNHYKLKWNPAGVTK